MNCKEGVLLRGRGRNRFARGRNNVVNVQRPLMGPPRRPPPKRNSTAQSTNSSNIIWKNPSCRTANTTILKSSSSRSHSTSYSLEMESRVIVAICEGRGDATCEVGIAAIDVSRPLLILSQISDSQSYVNTLTKINILNPHEILVPLTFVENFALNRLIGKVKNQFKETKITAVGRSTFNKTIGIQYIKELCAPQWNSVQLILQHKFYALAAAAALLNYTESILYVVYVKESIKVEYHESEGFTMIDVSTADQLELVASLSQRANKKYSSLFGIMNYCLTKIGSRILRASILQPPCCVSDIEARLACVTELKRNPSMMANIQSVLSKLANIDQLLSLATFLPEQEQDYSERQLNYVLMLNATLESVTPLCDALESAKQPFFVELRTTLSDESLETIKQLVRTVIHSDAHPAKGQQGIVQRCFAIKSGVNSLLDIIRKSYSERADEMGEYVKNLGEQYQMALTLSNNNKKGYHIVLKLDRVQKRTFKKSELPPEFIQVERLANIVTMKTQEIVNFSAIIYDILLEILKLSNIMIYNILVEVRGHIGLFYKLCDEVAKLDMFQSLAHASSGINYTQPDFREFLDVSNSRHPLLDYLCSTEPTSNSFSASNYFNMHIITGPNGSGKSIFIRQILLLQVMAQVGCFVPAESATFRVCDRILARIYFDGNMDCGASTFALEMKEVEYFRAVMSNNTLIIIDELCRSTAEEEGTAIAMAVCEDLAKSSAFVFFTTHFNFLTKIQDLYFNMNTWQLETIEETNDNGDVILHFTFNVVPGVTSLKKYGMFTAKASWPDHVWKIADEFLKQNIETRQAGETERITTEDRLKYALESDLKLLKLKKQLNVETLNDRCLQYVQSMEAIGFYINLADIVPNHNSGRSDNVFVEPHNLITFDSDRSSGYENFAMHRPNQRVVVADVHDNFVDQNRPTDWVFTPVQEDASFGQYTDVALRFNDSLRKDPDYTYIVPDIVYSETGSEDSFDMQSMGYNDRNDVQFSTTRLENLNFVDYTQSGFDEAPLVDKFARANLADNSDLSRALSQNFNATVNRVSKDFGSNLVGEISHANEADISMIISQKFRDCIGNKPYLGTFSNYAASDVSLNINQELVQESMRPFNMTSWTARSKSSDGDFQIDAPTLLKRQTSSNSLSSVNENQFSLPLQINDRKTSTPIFTYENQNQIRNLSCSSEVNKKPTTEVTARTKRSSDSSESIVWKSKHDKSHNLTTRNKPDDKPTESDKSSTDKMQSNSSSNCVGIDSRRCTGNLSDDRDVTAAIEDLQNCSEYFYDAEDWDNVSVDELPIVSQVNAIEITAIEDLQNCSEYFTGAEESDIIGDDVFQESRKNVQEVTSIACDQKEDDVTDNNEETKKRNIQIHSIYAFDKNNKLVNQYDNYANMCKMKDNITSNERGCVTISNVLTHKEKERYQSRQDTITDLQNIHESTDVKPSHRENRIIDDCNKNLKTVFDEKPLNKKNYKETTDDFDINAVTIENSENAPKRNVLIGQVSKEIVNASESSIDMKIQNVLLEVETYDENLNERKPIAIEKLEEDGVASNISKSLKLETTNLEHDKSPSIHLTNRKLQFPKTESSNTSTKVNVSSDANASRMSQRLNLNVINSGERCPSLSEANLPNQNSHKEMISKNTSTIVNVSSDTNASTSKRLKLEVVGNSTKRRNERSNNSVSINANISDNINSKRLKLEVSDTSIKNPNENAPSEGSNDQIEQNEFSENKTSNNSSTNVNVSSDVNASRISKRLNVETSTSGTDKSANAEEIDDVAKACDSNVHDRLSQVNEPNICDFENVQNPDVNPVSQLYTQKSHKTEFNANSKRLELESDVSMQTNRNERNVDINEEEIIDATQDEKKENKRCFKRLGLTRQVKTFEYVKPSVPASFEHNFFENSNENVSFSLDEANSLDIFEGAVDTNTSSDIFQTPEANVPNVRNKTTKDRGNTKKIKKRIMKFKPPKMLTKRQIEQEFYEQDKKILENYDPDKVNTYMEQIKNRPNVKQLQEQKHLAVIYKTDEGVVVMPTSPAKAKRKPKVVSLKKTASISDFDGHIFSDKNSEKFEGFLQSKKECESAFVFDANPGVDCVASTSRAGGTQFNFSVTKNESVFQNSETQESENVSFTPDGYYKENKSSIFNIIKKYI